MAASTLGLSYPDLVLTFSIVQQGHPVRSLAQLTGQDEDTCLRALHVLREASCAYCDSAHGHWQGLQGSPLRREADASRAHVRSSENVSSYMGALLQLEDGHLLAGCDAMLDAAHEFLGRGHSGAGLICLDILIMYAHDWSSEGQNDAEIRQYVTFIRCMLGLSMFLCKRVDAALTLLPKARQVALLLGDRRVSLLLDLTEASLRHLTQLHNTEPPRALLARTIKDIQDLGDADILASTARYIGILHFMQAEFHQAIDFLRMGSVQNVLKHFDYFEHSSVRYIASAACALGNDALAFGVVQAGQRAALAQGQRLSAKWCQVHLVDDLLRMGKTEAALPILDELVFVCDPETETRLWNWGQRNLAFYHFQCGHLDVAHRILHQGMVLSQRYGLNRPYYNFTWLFDLLWSFEEHGLPPVPGYELEVELNAALQGPNRQFKSAALRIRALQQEKAGTAPAAIAELAQHALEHAQAVGNPLETARAKRILARCYKAMGKQAEGDSLYHAACATLARYTQYDCPAHALQANQPYVPPAALCLQRLRQGMEALPLWETLEEHMRRIVLLVGDALEVERAALFQLGGKEACVCLGSYNIAAEEIHSVLFDEQRVWLLAQHGAESLVITHKEQGASLCVPLNVPGEGSLVLFAQCMFLPERIQHQKSQLFEDVGQAVALELRATFLLQKRMDEKHRQSEARARIAAAQVGSTETPYYGASLGRILQQADNVASTDASVLILGETGVGKEMLARRIHAYGGRIGPFVPVHPASTSEHLFESEFFGHEKGAFTGAQRQKIGLFELADKGTLFIDEVGDIPMNMQIKLLRVLQEKSFLRVGGTREIHSDFRLVCATNRDLSRMLREGTFREDLYYRVAVMPLYLPPLRERPEDVLLLAQIFMERFAKRYQREVPPLGKEDRACLRAYGWPGNIRELKSVMERSVILYTGGRMHLALGAGHELRQDFGEQDKEHADIVHNFLAALAEDVPSMEVLQARYIRSILERTRGKIDGPQGAAAILGMKRSTLYAKIRKYGLDSYSLAYGAVGR